MFLQNNEMETGGGITKAGWGGGGSIMSRKPTPATPSGTRKERRATELRRKGVGYGVEGGDVVLVVAFVQGFHVPVTSQQKRKKVKVAYPCVY